MSNENVFNKKLAPESTMDKVEGLLEHFNLPPKVIAYIRKHQRKIQVGLAIVILAVVAWSFYSSYVEQMTEEGATALAVAMKKTGTEKTAALENVVNEYSSSSSALWAKIELAHHDMEAKNFSSAAEKYEKILAGLSQDGPLYPLVLFGVAQAHEGNKNYSESYAKYDLLKAIKGYEHIGYTGMARLEEAQNNIDKAIAIYNNFLLAVGEDQTYSEAKVEVDNKIARLKAKK